MVVYVDVVLLILWVLVGAIVAYRSYKDAGPYLHPVVDLELYIITIFVIVGTILCNIIRELQR